MTKAQLEAVVEALVEIVSSWNEAAADEDRGPGNDAICLTLGDDGSGSIGRRNWFADSVEDFHDFADLDDLIGILKDEGTEVKP